RTCCAPASSAAGSGSCSRPSFARTPSPRSGSPRDSATWSCTMGSRPAASSFTRGRDASSATFFGSPTWDISGRPTSRASSVPSAVRTAVGGVRVRCIVNPRYREGAILSLWAARDWLSGPVVVMDADVLCPAEMLRRLVGSPQPNCFLLDASVVATGEEQMLLTANGRVRDIVRGGAPGYELAGESVGFLKLSAAAASLLRDLLAERVARGDTGIEHEEVYPDLL